MDYNNKNVKRPRVGTSNDSQTSGSSSTIPGTSSQLPGPITQTSYDSDKRRTEGAHIGGQKFEMYVATMLGTRGLELNHNFKLETNIGEKSAGNMDDVVYHLNDRTYYLQLKHSENPENYKFQPKEMMELLYSCMKSFYIITKNKTADKCVFIIFTNRDLGQKLSDTYETLITYIDDFLLTDRNMNQVFKFKYSDKIYDFMSNRVRTDKKSIGISTTIDQNMIKEFLNNIILTTCQKGRDDIKKIIIETIKRYDSVRVSPKLYEQVFDNLMVYVEDWWERKSAIMDTDIIYQWLKEAKSKVFDSLLTEMNGQNKLINVKFKMQQLHCLKALLRNSHLMQIETRCLEMTCTKVVQSLNIDHIPGKTNEVQYICTSDVAILRRRTEVLYAWQGGLQNWLIICWHGQVDNDITDEVNRISLEKTEKMVIFITDKSMTLDGFWKISDDFSLEQLEDNSVHYVLEQPLNFQGEDVLLQELYNNNVNLMSSITAEHVTEILSDQKPVIGRQLEKQVHYYIDRGLQSNMYVSFDILKDTSISDRFAISGIRKDQLKQLIPEGENIGRYYASVGKGFYEGTNQERYIVLEWTFQSLVEMTGMNRSLHWLSLEGNKLKWKESHASLNSFTDILNKYLEAGKRHTAVEWLRRYIFTLGLDNQIQNKELCVNTAWELNKRSTLIIAEPGMGKTTYITKIAFDTKYSKPTSWIIRINWNEHTQFLNHITSKKSGWSDADVSYLLWKCVSGKETAVECTPLEHRSLEYTLFSYAVNLVLLMDGFDEISPTYTETALELLNFLLHDKRVRRLWVTSRPVMREKIEEALNTISFGITPLTEKNQRSLLLQLWNLSNDDQSRLLDDFIREMLDGANYYLNDTNFSTIPLHLVMLAMAFESDMKQTIDIQEVYLPEQFKVLDIYEKFIERKRDIYITDKNKADISNVGTIDAYETVWEVIEKNHMRSALFVLFNQYLNVLHDPKIESKTNEFVSRIMEGKDRAGVVVQVVEEKPFFVHRTFAEYFAAKWFVRYYRKNRRILAEVLCEEINKVMRDMMDHILVGENKLNRAVLNREEDTVKSILASNEVNINALDGGGRNALHMVVGRNIETVTQLLIRKGISADVTDDVLEWTPAQYAIMIEDWESAGMLLDAQANQHPHSEQVIRKLREIHISRSLPMHTACTGGYIKLAELLVQHGADVNKYTTYTKGKPLHVAVDMKNLEMVEWLIQHGADKDSTDANDVTPFFAAVLRGYVPTAVWFLKNGWGRSVLDRSGETPFHFAAMSNSKEMTELLIESGKFSISQPDKSGQTPLHYASKYGKQQVMRCLVEHGADINAQDQQGMTSLHWAALEGKMSSILYLLEQEAIDKNRRDNEDCTPLHYAAANENDIGVKFILEEQGIEIECHDRNGCTPLHYAASKGQRKAVELLFNRCTEKHPRDHEGRTPLHLAVEHAHFQVIKWLIENGNAEINCVDNSNRTPLSIVYNLDNLEEKQKILQYFELLENATLQSGDMPMET